jgi:hypothetical protein
MRKREDALAATMIAGVDEQTPGTSYSFERPLQNNHAFRGVVLYQ